MKGTALPTLVVLALLAPGCHHVRTPAPEPVTVTRLSLDEASVDRADFGLALAVRNPRGWAGTLRAVNWELWLDGKWFATGTQELNLALPRTGMVPLELKLQTAFKRPASSPQPSTVATRVRGNLRVDFPLGPEQLTFESSAILATLGAPLAPVNEVE